MSVESIIRKHMEAMHDELAFWLRNGGPEREKFTALGFAKYVASEIDKGTMYSSEYVDWYEEEVGQ